MMMRKIQNFVLIGAIAGLTPMVWAADIEDVLEQGDRRTSENAVRQASIDSIAEDTDKDFRSYVQKLRENNNLRAYNSSRERQIKSQLEQIEKTKNDINEISRVVREAVPLMESMTESLTEFVRLDIPFLIEERLERMDNLLAILERPDVSESEKFRKVLEAYQIELEYGQTIETYQSGFVAEEGAPEETVNYLRIGRISYTAQSLDGSRSYLWDRQNQYWSRISSAEYAKALKLGINIASKKIAPDLIKVPVSLTSSALSR